MIGKFESLTIAHETETHGKFDGGPIKVLFNPNELTYTKRLNWGNPKPATSKENAATQGLEFTSEELETLALNLFFDTYELFFDPDPAEEDDEPPPAGEKNSLFPKENPEAERLEGEQVPRGEPLSVLDYTRPVVELSRFRAKLGRPPVCELQWGEVFVFRGVLESITQKITLFLRNGTPVRSTLDCQFKQFLIVDDRLVVKSKSKLDAKLYEVRPGDTLTSIAHEMYGDCNRWRTIAGANGIDDPSKLPAGTKLTIPKLR